MNIVMTGGTSGLGQQAVQRLSGVPDVRILLGARRLASEGARPLPLDLAKLVSVREFAGAVDSEIGTEDIDVLLLNAGIQFSDLSHRTEDGFETTFGVNHLAHYLLLRLLLPKLADGAAVILTTSDTHDPKTNPLGAPRSLDPEKLAHPPEGARNGFGAGFRAYAASKLCNLLTARALASSQVALDRQLRVIAYNPGFTPGTGLNRTWPAWARIALIGGKALRPILRLNTVQDAGGTLADLALARAVPPPGRVYGSLVRRHLTWPNPSELAQRDDVMRELWDASARLLGLPSEI